MLQPFNFQHWIDTHQHLLKPPVGNKSVFDQGGMIAQVGGGSTCGFDFHDDPVMVLLASLVPRGGFGRSTPILWQSLLSE